MILYESIRNESVDGTVARTVRNARGTRLPCTVQARPRKQVHLSIDRGANPETRGHPLNLSGAKNRWRWLRCPVKAHTWALHEARLGVDRSPTAVLWLASRNRLFCPTKYPARPGALLSGPHWDSLITSDLLLEHSTVPVSCLGPLREGHVSPEDTPARPNDTNCTGGLTLVPLVGWCPSEVCDMSQEKYM